MDAPLATDDNVDDDVREEVEEDVYSPEEGADTIALE